MFTRVLTANLAASAFHLIPICPPPCADPTLNINNLSQVAASVKNWNGLGQDYGGLGVPCAVRDKINTAYQTEEEKKEALLLYYLPMASWPSVAGAPHRREEKTASQAVKVFLKDTPAGQPTYRDYISVCTVHIIIRLSE